MHRMFMLALAILAIAVWAGASTLNSAGLVIPGTGGPYSADRLGLIDDGSFESGLCGVVWTCYTDTTCEDRILDPLGIWGYPAYDGMYAAWVGGFCGGIPSTNGLCHNIFIDGMYLDWYWMGYMEYDDGGVVSCFFDGVPVFQYSMGLAEHTYGSWNSLSSFFGLVDVSAYCGQTVEICFDFTVSNGLGGNMLIDYVTIDESCGTATMNSDFSTVKALY